MINNILKNIKFKYKKYREINNVIGFVVNVHNATNYDIDLILPQHIHDKYKTVIINNYSYNEVDEYLNIQNEVKYASTYRCRLKGIGINYDYNNLNPANKTNISKSVRSSDDVRSFDDLLKKEPQTTSHSSNYSLTIDIKQLIDRTDGWVLCKISDIDVYKRLLVEIIVPTTDDINLKSLILDKMKNYDKPLYYPYVFKQNKPILKWDNLPKDAHPNAAPTKPLIGCDQNFRYDVTKPAVVNLPIEN